jgi:acyl-CoA thioesterase I
MGDRQMMRRILCVCAIGAVLGTASGHGAEPPEHGRWTLAPFWKTAAMERESVMFVQDGGGFPSASLLFIPTRIIRVESADGRTVYNEGKDYTWTPGNRTLSLSKGSRIPFKTEADLYPPKGAPQSIEGRRGGAGALFFGEGHLFHDLQKAVTYDHDERWKGYIPSYEGKNLPRTIGLLGEKKPVTLLLFGDSISEGYNASGFTQVPPYQPPYGKLLARALEAHYRTTVNFINRSLAGKTTEWAVMNAGKAAEAEPDLAIIAFGMNDASVGMRPETFAANVKSVMDTIRAVSPSCEFILVAGMTGNPEWTFSAPQLYPKYRDSLARLCGKGIVLADMTSVWTEILARKRFVDITGNGVNHPNDFGHRLYAEVLTGLLIR